MAEIIQFETAEMSTRRWFRQSLPGLAESAKRMQAMIDDPLKSDRSKLEAKMAKAIFEFDDTEFYRVVGILERMNAWLSSEELEKLRVLNEDIS